MSLPRPRPLVLLLLTALPLLAALALSACGAAEKVRAAGDPVEEAVAATAKADGARFTMRISFTAPEVPAGVAFTATGASNLRSGDTRMSFDMGALAEALGEAGRRPELGDMELRIVDRVMYLKMDLLAGELPDGKTWVSASIDELGKQMGLDVSQLTGAGDPTRMLEYLRDAGSVTEVGRERVRGVQTTRYRAEIDLDDALSALGGASGAASGPAREAVEKLAPEGTLPVDVWVGDDGLLRRMDFRLAVDEEGFAIGARMDLFGYGSKVSVAAPPAAEVADGSELFGTAPAGTP